MGLPAICMQHMISAVQSLPDLGNHDQPDAIPSVVLAQILYQDPTRAAELEGLNDVPHPLFMPPSGLALSS